MESLSDSLAVNLKKNWREWIKAFPDVDVANLYIMLVADSRTVLFIFQSNTETVSIAFEIFENFLNKLHLPQVTLIDSHQHSAEKGAFIATAKISKLKYLCQWYTDVLKKYYNCIPDLYEISLLYFNYTC